MVIGQTGGHGPHAPPPVDLECDLDIEHVLTQKHLMEANHALAEAWILNFVTYLAVLSKSKYINLCSIYFKVDCRSGI